AWAKEDDEKEKEKTGKMGVTSTPAPAPAPAPAPSATTTTTKPSEDEIALNADAEAETKPPPHPQPHPWTLAPAPSTALVGLSMLGNLDGVYAHATYPALALHTLTTGSRQRAGAVLLFGYTFCGRLWLSLGFDENGVERRVVGAWWEEVVRGVDEFLVG
ncbi:hypothetical protein EW145_g7685, partial [Phellinidium pouzarii]